jgi:diguanylate cyclase (GGDEF)-like protein
MVHEEALSAVLSEFARTLATDFPIQAILDHLVVRIVDVLPVTAAGVTLIAPGSAPRYVAASGSAALRFERLQTDLGDGPCLLAYDSGEAVAASDMSLDHRFPRFGPAAVTAGLAAVFAFPMRHGNGRLGALDLYRDTVGPLNPADMAAAQTLADVAAAYLLNAEARAEAKQSSDAFRYSSLHDPLTGLPNRMLLQERLEHAAQRGQRSHTSAAILFADLDRFKVVNDTHGHQIGDELLRAVASRLASLVRPGDTLARFSGDEFVFLCEDLHSVVDAESLAARVDEAFSHPFAVSNLQLMVTASVGVAYAGPGEDISNALVVEADVAMYQAKRKGGGRHQIIDLREALKNDARRALEPDLRTAFEQDELHLAYQPIVRNTDDRIIAVEALLRWTHPEQGAIAATSMVTVAEETRLIISLGAWVLERACRDRGEWLAAHPKAPIDIAVNVSARQLMSPDFCPMIAGVLERTGMDPAALILEITENILIKDADRAMTVLTDLKLLGVRLALDDFGTGYSSLSYLLRLPIDIVKIDQSFVADLSVAANGSAIVAAVTRLAHVLDLTVTAEGVETEEQRNQVRAIGCDCAQGFFYSAAVSAAEIGDQLSSSDCAEALMSDAVVT